MTGLSGDLFINISRIYIKRYFIFNKFIIDYIIFFGNSVGFIV